MNRRLAGVLCWSVFVVGAGVGRAEVTRYYDAAPADGEAFEGRCLQVIYVIEGLPGWRAGIRTGDRIAGLDGSRLRAYADLVYLRCRDGRRRDMTLSVVRDGKCARVHVRQVIGLRQCGIVVNGEMDRTQLPWNITHEEVFGVAPPPAGGETEGNLADLADASAQPFFSLWDFPPRARDIIDGLAARGDPAVRAWVVQLYKVYGLLLTERFRDARELIASQKLEERAADPFLKRLVSFYRSLAEIPVSSNGVPLDRYGVDATFFTFCYPFPVIAEPLSSSFASDPEFQRMFDRLSFSFYGEEAEAVEMANRLSSSSSTDPECYVNQVKAALLDWGRHGGWPHRSSLVSKPAERDAVLQALVKRLDELPERKVETALAILAPSLISKDEGLLREAYGIAARAGFREATAANKIVRNTISTRNIRGIDVDNMLDQGEAERPVAAIYQYLATVSPAVKNRMAMGYYVRGRFGVQDVGGFCHDRASMTAQILECPLPAGRVEGMISSAIVSGKPEPLAQALDCALTEAAYDPTPRSIDAFFKLRRKVGTGPFGEAFGLLLQHWIGTPWRSDGDGLRKRWTSLVSETEETHYARVAEESAAWKTGDPDLEASAARLFEQAGVPSISLLLASRLKAAGLAEAAEDYRLRAFSLDDGLVKAFGWTAETAACRDFVSLPGFDAFVTLYEKRLEIVSTEASLMVLALLSLRRGEMDAFVQYVIKASGASHGYDACSFLYDGSVYNSGLFLRQRLLTDLLVSKAFSPAQIERLRAVERIGLAAIEETLPRQPGAPDAR